MLPQPPFYPPVLPDPVEQAGEAEREQDFSREFREPLPPGYLLVEIVGILFLIGLMLLSLLLSLLDLI